MGKLIAPSIAKVDTISPMSHPINLDCQIQCPSQLNRPHNVLLCVYVVTRACWSETQIAVLHEIKIIVYTYFIKSFDVFIPV